jgi:hypothetical protein
VPFASAGNEFARVCCPLAVGAGHGEVVVRGIAEAVGHGHQYDRGDDPHPDDHAFAAHAELRELIENASRDVDSAWCRRQALSSKA